MQLLLLALLLAAEHSPMGGLPAFSLDLEEGTDLQETSHNNAYFCFWRAFSREFHDNLERLKQNPRVALPKNKTVRLRGTWHIQVLLLGGIQAGGGFQIKINIGRHVDLKDHAVSDRKCGEESFFSTTIPVRDDLNAAEEAQFQAEAVKLFLADRTRTKP